MYNKFSSQIVEIYLLVGTLSCKARRVFWLQIISADSCRRRGKGPNCGRELVIEALIVSGRSCTPTL